jgi:hypothetical protein
MLYKGEVMLHMKKYLFPVLLSAVISLPLSVYGEGHQGPKAMSGKDPSTSSGTEQKPDYPLMPEPGKKVQLAGGSYFIYNFDKKPKLGPVIIKVEIYNSEGKKDTSMEIKGDAGMPSMGGAHETGERSFKLSRNGVYLLPIDIVMPGDWEIRLTFLKKGKVIFRGSYKFDV